MGNIKKLKMYAIENENNSVNQVNSLLLLLPANSRMLPPLDILLVASPTLASGKYEYNGFDFH